MQPSQVFSSSQKKYLRSILHLQHSNAIDPGDNQAVFRNAEVREAPGSTVVLRLDWWP